MLPRLYRLVDAGPFRFLTNPNDVYASKAVEVYGEWSAGEIAIMALFLKEGSIVVEVGANIGTHTVPLAHLVGRAGRVHAFEPQRLTFQLLNANLALNHCVNAHAHRNAVGRAPGSLRLKSYNPDQIGNYGGLALTEAADGESTPIVTLDAMRAETGRVTLLKVDAEGSEGEVLAGATTVLRQDRPVLYVENDRAPLAAALIEQIWALDYRLWWHVVPLFRPNNFAHTRENIFGRLVSINMLGLPAETEPPTLPDGLRPVTTAAPFQT